MNRLWLLFALLVILFIAAPLMAAYDNGWEFRCDAGRCVIAQEDFAEIIAYIRELEKRVVVRSCT